MRRVHLMRGENGFGFTLRGDSPVLIAGVIPGGCAAVSTLSPAVLTRYLRWGNPPLRDVTWDGTQCQTQISAVQTHHVSFAVDQE